MDTLKKIAILVLLLLGLLWLWRKLRGGKMRGWLISDVTNSSGNPATSGTEAKDRGVGTYIQTSPGNGVTTPPYLDAPSSPASPFVGSTDSPVSGGFSPGTRVQNALDPWRGTAAPARPRTPPPEMLPYNIG